MNFEKTNFEEMTGWICGKSEVWKLLNSGPPVHSMEKEMATHSSVLAWRIPGTGEPHGLLSMGLHRVGHDWSDLAAAAAVHSNSIQRLVIIVFFFIQFSSVQFSHSVVFDSLQPHKSQHARPPCTSPSPSVHWNSRPSSRCCHPAISSSVVPFSSCPQSLPASESFPMRQLFTWGCQSIGVSALASFLPKNTQGWPPLGRWKIQEMDDSESCTTMWMYLVSLNYTVKYG